MLRCAGSTGQRYPTAQNTPYPSRSGSRPPKPPNQAYKFNSTWIDDFEINSILIEWEGTNYSTENYTGDIYNWTILNLGVGTYNYKWYGTDDSGNTNVTNLQTYTINKANTSCSLSFDQTSPVA